SGKNDIPTPPGSGTDIQKITSYFEKPSKETHPSPAGPSQSRDNDYIQNETQNENVFIFYFPDVVNDNNNEMPPLEDIPLNDVEFDTVPPTQLNEDDTTSPVSAQVNVGGENSGSGSQRSINSTKENTQRTPISGRKRKERKWDLGRSF
ncbi:hypothetical protein KI387_041737, partial [Taxus chinensis]